MEIDAALRDMERIERTRRVDSAQFLIRTNSDREGWVTDGVFGKADAIDFLQSHISYAPDGATIEYNVYALDPERGYPVQMIPTGHGDRIVFRESGLRSVALEIQLPPGHTAV